MRRSDKYLEDERKSSKKESAAKKSKKSKKSKKVKDHLESDSDDDDIKPMHFVNTTIEMPEGAVMSDTDDKNDLDKNDPHRALDIDLEADLVLAAKPTVKSAKKSSEVVKSKEEVPESLEKKKKDKKKHKRRKDDTVDLFQTEPEVLAPVIEKPEKKPKKDKKEKKDKSKSKKSKNAESVCEPSLEISSKELI